MLSGSSSDLTSNWSPTTTVTEKNRQMHYFKETLSEAGVILNTDGIHNILTQEQSLVIRDLEKIIEKHPMYPRNIEKFLAGLERLCKDEEEFRKALMPCDLQKSAPSADLFNTTENIQQQESIFRIMLNVDSLRKVVMNLLLDNLVMYATEENIDESWVPLLLNALRYLPYIKQPNILSTKLLDTLDVATYESQLEILNAIPEIIPDIQYDETAKQLGVFLDQNNNLAGAVVNCLNLLQISAETKADIQDRILARLFTENYFKIFPILYEFLITDSNMQTLQPIFTKIRSMLDLILSESNGNAEMETNKTVLLAKLQSSALSTKLVYDTWIQLLTSIRSGNDHKPVDVILLFMLHSTTKTRRHNTETLFKKKIKAGLLKISLLETFFQKYTTPQFLKDYFNTFVEVASFLLQNSKNSLALREFVSVLYRELFLHKNTDCIQHQDIIHNLILATSTADQEIVGAVLKIFSDLLETDMLKLQKHTLQIMSLLEKLDVFELKDVKECFEILCGLTCGEKANDDTSGLKDEIHMIIRKQLSSAKKTIKHRGIVAAVVMAKCIVSTSVEQSEISVDEDTSFSIADLQDANTKEAAGLLDLTNISSAGSPDSIGLFYDELASMLISSENLDKYFLAWLKDTITNDFQNIFVAENFPSSINDVPLSAQYSLNSEEEINEPICVNIAEVTIQSKTNQILTLSPMFRLLRLLHFRQHNGDLGTIDALLGCGVVMPNISSADSMDSDQIKQAIDCVYHCSNWFRENISAFVSQKSRILRRKVVARIQNLIELEELILELIIQVPEHKLPVVSFDSTLSSEKTKHKVDVASKKGRKAAKSKEIVNETTTSVITQATKSTRIVKNKSDLEIHFRELDTDVMLLLKYAVKVGDNQMQSSQNDIQLDLKQFCYILKDVITKLALLVQEKRKGLSVLNSVKLSSVIKDFQLFLPNINNTLYKIKELLKQTLEQNDGRYDLPEFFNEETQELKGAFGLILHCLSLLFSWHGFQDNKNLNLLRDYLKALREETSSQLNSASKLMLEFVNRLYNNYIKVCLCLSHAVDVVKTMQAFYTISENEDIKKMIVAAAGKFLKKRWYNANGQPDVGKQYNININILLKAYLDGADVKTICGLIGTLQKQAPSLQTKEDTLHMLGSIDKPALPVFFQSLCSSLLERVRSQLSSLTNREHLVLWKTTGLSLQGLMAVVKIHETRVNLLCFLKKSLGILKLFLNQGIPILEIMLKAKPDEVVDIFKTMQSTTRFLHHLCCHSKLTKDTSLISYVPQFRLTLETLVYRVKAALVANNCSDAFWMGNLRNRDLHGEDILTQDSTSTENGNDEEEEDVMPEDEDSEDDAVAEETSTSASEII